MQFQLPFKARGGWVSEEKALNGPQGLVPRNTSVSLRTTQKVLASTLSQAGKGRSNRSVVSLGPFTDTPMAKIGWGSLDPSVPKKVSLSRRTLDPSLREDANTYNYSDIMRETSATPSPHQDSARHSREHLPATEQHRALMPSRMASMKRHTQSGQQPSTAPTEEGLPSAANNHDPNSREPYPAPVSRYNSSSGALARTANKTAQLTKLDAQQRNHHYHRGPRQHPPSEDGSEDTVLITLDQKCFKQGSSLEIAKDATRAERHAANKKLYYIMKAENHNLWVLLDASNRRADSMMQTLRDEEERCQVLERQTQHLQATLDTLNTRRLMIANQTDTESIYTQADLGLGLIEPALVDTSEVEQVTAELDHLRKNLAQSRNSVRKLKLMAEEGAPPPVPRVPSTAGTHRETSLPQRELERSIHKILQPEAEGSPKSALSVETSFTQVDNMESKLQTLITPKPVRPKHCSTELTLLEHIEAILEPGIAEETASAFSTPPQTPCNELVQLSKPATPPKDDVEIKLRRSTSFLKSASTPAPTWRFSADSGESESHSPSSSIRSSTPELGSTHSSSGSETASAPPTPPPKSARRLTARSSTAQIQIHPALRVDTKCASPGKPVQEMTPLLERLDLAV